MTCSGDSFTRCEEDVFQTKARYRNSRCGLSSLLNNLPCLVMASAVLLPIGIGATFLFLFFSFSLSRRSTSLFFWAVSNCFGRLRWFNSCKITYSLLSQFPLCKKHRLRHSFLFLSFCFHLYSSLSSYPHRIIPLINSLAYQLGLGLRERVSCSACCDVCRSLTSYGWLDGHSDSWCVRASRC